MSLEYRHFDNMSSKIIIADDHPLLRTAVRQTVEKLWPHHAIIEVATLAAANEAAHEYAASGNVELLLLDLLILMIEACWVIETLKFVLL